MLPDQTTLESFLNRQQIIPVHISDVNPLPNNNPAYSGIRNIEQTGFVFTPFQLIHAIGCKTAALPSSAQDECIKAAWLYIKILDLEGQHLSFRANIESDLQTPRSQEIGIGFTCLIGEHYFGIPFDQLGSLPGRGKRFDYRGSRNGLECIFESKGTSHRKNQYSQIMQGIEKKESHHERNEHFDVELIISAYIGRNNEIPRIILADPDETSLRRLFGRGDDRYYRLKHYCRVLQFIGLPESAYSLNLYARDYLNNKLSIYKMIQEEKSRLGFLTSIKIDDEEFLGRWFSSWLPDESIRYRKLADKYGKSSYNKVGGPLRVFQGVKRDIYESGFDEIPFTHKLLSRQQISNLTKNGNSKYSIFPDGTILFYEIG